MTVLVRPRKVLHKMALVSVTSTGPAYSLLTNFRSPPVGHVWIPQILNVFAAADQAVGGPTFCTVWLGTMINNVARFPLEIILCPIKTGSSQSLPFTLNFAQLNNTLHIRDHEVLGFRIAGGPPTGNLDVIGSLRYQELRVEDAELMEL